MKPKFLLCFALVLGGGLFALAVTGKCNSLAAMPPSSQLFPGATLQSIQMIDRKNGWALTDNRFLAGGDWRFLGDLILRTTDGGKSWKIVLATTDSWQRLAPCFYDSK